VALSRSKPDGPEAEAPDLINPTQLLAEAAVRESIG
jgi:hypothetical protein